MIPSLHQHFGSRSRCCLARCRPMFAVATATWSGRRFSYNDNDVCKTRLNKKVDGDTPNPPPRNEPSRTAELDTRLPSVAGLTYQSLSQAPSSTGNRLERKVLIAIKYPPFQQSHERTSHSAINPHHHDFTVHQQRWFLIVGQQQPQQKQYYQQ
jgi:hypothetical protein